MMTMAPIELPKLIEAIGSVAWPFMAAVVAWKLFPAVRTIVQSRAFKVKVGDAEITVQQASDQIGHELKDLQDHLGALRKQATAVLSAPANRTLLAKSTASPNRILWVDDNPANNAFLVAKLREDGCEVRSATSTSQAIGILGAARTAFDAIVSDMGRIEDEEYRREAGMKLLVAVKMMGLSTPFIVYSTGATAAEYRDMVCAGGGVAATGSPVELLGVLREILQGSK
jgi:CheY-like chemotaxis protein